MQPVQKMLSLVEKQRDKVLAAEAYIWSHPQTGYKEWEAHAYMKNIFEELGYSVVEAGNIPGFIADLDTGRPGPKFCIMAELDSLICKDHPDARPETGAVHACGHCAQCAAMVGIAAALKEPGALDDMSGSIRLMVVPAEELIETGYRESLRQQGVIKYMGGKVEFMSRGFFDGVDMAMLIHQTTGDGPIFSFSRGCNGCVVKNIDFLGKASHAGGAPHLGVNALYAANTAMSVVNSLRETFKDDDHIRFHPIITEGGQAVNAIPSLVRVESYVRGASFEAIVDVNERVNRALAASAAAYGANVHLGDRPGYGPLENNRLMEEYAMDVAREFLDATDVADNGGWDTGCTDVGDVSAVIPSIQPYIRGCSGIGHGNNYQVSDPEMACVLSAKLQVATAWKLLSDDAKLGKKVLAETKTRFGSIAEYLAYVDRLTLDKDAVIQNPDGTITLDFRN